MKKDLFAFVVLFLAVCHLQAQDVHSFQWTYTPDGSAHMNQLDVLPLADRGYMLYGLMENPAGSGFYYPYLVRLNCRGQVVWTKMFNQATETINNTSGRILKVAEDDYVVVGTVGFYYTTPRQDIFVARVDGEGDVQWAQRIGGGTNNQDVAQDAILTSDGNIVIAGQTGSWGTDANTNNNYTDQYFVKIRLDGALLWTRTVGNAQKVDRAFAIVEMPDQSLVAAGSYIHTGGTFYANLVKLDQNSTVLWNKVVGEGVAPQANHGYGLLVTSDGGLLLTGSSTNMQTNFQGYPDFLIVKTDDDGNPEWSRVVAGGASDFFENASNAIEKENGDFAVMCATNSFPTVGFVGNKYAVLTLSPTGSLVSTKTYNAGSSHYPRILPHPQENSFLIAGFTNWTGYGGNGSQFTPLLINLDAELSVSCNYTDYTGLTTVYNPSFDFDEALSTLGTGGEIITSIVTTSSFNLVQNIVCEQNPYEVCTPVNTEDVAEAFEGLKAVPNPAFAGSTVSLRWDDGEVEQVMVVDVNGRVVGQYYPVPGLKNVDVRMETPGVYGVTLMGKGKTQTKKILVF